MLDNVNSEMVHSRHDMEKFVTGKTKDGKMFNQIVKRDNITLANVDKMTKAFTNFVFSTGSLEEKLSSPNSQLSQEDLKLINERVEYVCTIIAEDR